MVVLILECVPPGLRGELTRGLIEPKTGIFVGRISAMVRDRLWTKVCGQAGAGGCVMINASNSEQDTGSNTRVARAAFWRISTDYSWFGFRKSLTWQVFSPRAWG